MTSRRRIDDIGRRDVFIMSSVFRAWPEYGFLYMWGLSAARQASILLLLLCVPSVAQRTIDTVAGGFMPNSVPAAGTELISVTGLTGDAPGDVYFADSRYVIRRIRTDGTIETMAGNGLSRIAGDGGSATAASLLGPTKLTWDNTGNLFLLDGARIRRVDFSGNITTVAGTGIYGSLGADGPATLAQIDPPGDIAAGSDGAVYFSETNDNRVRKLTPDGRIALVATFNQPSALAVDSSGSLFVAEGNQSIRRIAADGTISTYASGFTSIRALAVGAQGIVYVGDCSSGAAGCQIRSVGRDGTVKTIAGGASTGSMSDGPAASALIAAINGVWADPSGNVYFGDALPARIRRVTPQSMVETIAGGAPAYAPDGPDARRAWLVSPMGIAADRSANLYIAENCMIRRVAPDGGFTTTAGTGRCAGTAQSGPIATTDLPYLSDVVATSQGQVYAADQSGNLLSIAPGKTISLVSGVKGAQRLAIDSQDWLYATTPPTITRIKPGAAPEMFAGPNGSGAIVNLALGSNSVIAIDSAHNLYVAFAQNGSGSETVYRITADGKLSEYSTLRVAPPLDSLAVDAAGKVYGTNHSLIGFDYLGTGFRGDGGPLSSAAVNLPSRLIVAPSGDFCFLDLNNRRARKISGSPAATPVFSSAGVVNAASGITGPVAPGELISIYGTNLGPASGWVNTPENNGYLGVAGYSRFVLGPGGTFSNGAPMPIWLANANQINAFVPYTVAGATSIPVQVEVDGVLSAPVTLSVAASAFGVFTANGSGTGQGAILNQDGSYNSATNPAARGSIISLYGTGDGNETPTPGAGMLVLSVPYPAPTASITVTIGGQPADVSYAGAAPFLPAGVTQINARIPQGIAPGDAPIMISVGGLSTTQAVTVAVK